MGNQIKIQTNKSETTKLMEVIQSAPAASEPDITTVAHGIQRDRQEFLSRLIENASVKMELLRQDAEADVESE